MMKRCWKMSGVAGLCYRLLFLQSAFGQRAGFDLTQHEVSLNFQVRYVTTEALYFNGGTADGLRPDDHVWVIRHGEKILLLKIKYVAAHSACCLLKKETDENRGDAVVIKVDDLILCVLPREEFVKRTSPPARPEQDERAPAPQKKPPMGNAAPKRSSRRSQQMNNLLNGQISLQTFGQKDKGPQQFDFLESSAYWRLDFSRPAGLPLRLMVRVRSSQNYQQIGTTGMQKQPVLHRVYEIALEYASPATPLELAVGRTLRYELRGVGYLDGLVLGYRVNEIWKAGVFAGTQPDLYHYEFRPDEKKLGGFLQMKTTVGKSAEINVLATGTGRYMRQQISREYFAAEVDFGLARQLYLSQYFELDFNRNWRRKMAGSAFDLSNAYFNATYYPRTWITLGASYDARRLVRTWETHSIVDSLFDQALRQGWRASVALQPTALTRIALDGGWQGQKDSPAVYSAGLSASVSNLLRSGAGVTARLSYFGNAVSAGYYPALEVSRNFFGVVYATVGSGAYLYRMASAGKTQTNPWERLRMDINLTRRFFLSGTFENFHGDTMKFVRGFVDLGWRF